MLGKLILEDGTIYEGRSFGGSTGVDGEVVFSTGMVGYPETLTDPSYSGQIVVASYPLIGNYGVPDPMYWESDYIHASGLIVSQYIDTPSHILSKRTLASWLVEENIPALEIKDTRQLVLKLRDKGVMLGRIAFEKNDKPFFDPNSVNMVADISRKEPLEVGTGKKTVIVFDCGVKNNTPRSFIERGVKTIIVPWDFDLFNSTLKYDGIFVSNGPGDPKLVTATITTAREALNRKIPFLGICLGNQILALAAGGDTYKMKFGHRSQNQPCKLVGTDRCYLTTQNHGFAVGKVPKGFKPWFENANDGSNEGIVHDSLPFMSVQFHPEAMPGPVDTKWIFDHYIKHL
ncbi:MAG: glutamine-hydrolyzing carbamoyl-phosphate synthase small subunit [Weeksellaceae bacterium]